MAYPNLYNDEQKLLEAQNIKVKSVPFNAILTDRRLILLDSRKPNLPPQEILLATLKNVDSGENAIRDPTITLSIVTTSGTTRQMIMTFSKTSGGERRRESDEWVRVFRNNISHIPEHPVIPDVPAMEGPVPAPDIVPPATAPPPRIEIVNPPQQKKRIEVSRPMKTIVESVPAMPKPVETTSLPVGSFCNRCGSRVPPDSAFCNRCGTPVVKDSDLDAALHPPEPQVQPQPVPPAPAEPASPEPVPPEPAPEVPRVSVPVTPVYDHSSARKERPIEEVIHSIEPLIDDSVPRADQERHVTGPAPARVEETPDDQKESSGGLAEIRWPVINQSETEPEPEPSSPPAAPPAYPAPPMPPPVPARQSSGMKWIGAAVAVVVIIGIVAAVFLFANPFQAGGAQSPAPETTVEPATPSVTTTMTAVATTVPAATATEPVTTPAQTTAPSIPVPEKGVWVHVLYANQFSGAVGTPNYLRDVSGSGEQYFQISTSTGPVSAVIQKDDGTADPLTVEVYKDGEFVTKKSTTAPKGTVELFASLKPEETPTPVPTTVPVVTTMNTGSEEQSGTNVTATETAADNP